MPGGAEPPVPAVKTSVLCQCSRSGQIAATATQKQISLSSDQGPGIVLAIDVPMIGLQLTGKETQPPQLNTRPHCFERVSQLSIAGAVCCSTQGEDDAKRCMTLGLWLALIQPVYSLLAGC